MSDRRAFRVLAIVDWKAGGRALERPAWSRSGPETVTVDNGSKFCSRAVDERAYRIGVKLDFIRPGRPVENRLIESFSGSGATNA